MRVEQKFFHVSGAILNTNVRFLGAFTTASAFEFAWKKEKGRNETGWENFFFFNFT